MLIVLVGLLEVPLKVVDVAVVIILETNMHVMFTMIGE